MQALSLTAPMRFVCGSPRSQPTTRATYALHSPVILSPTDSPTMNSQALLASYARPRRRSTRSSVSSLISSVLQLAGNSSGNVSNDSAARDGENEHDASMAFEKRTVTSAAEGCLRKSLLSETLKAGACEKSRMLKGIRINTSSNGEARQASSVEDHVSGATSKRSLKFGNCPHVVRDSNHNTDGADTSSQVTRTHHDNTDASSIASISTVGSWKKSKHHFSPPPTQSLLTKRILGEAGVNKDDEDCSEDEDEEDGYLEDDEDDYEEDDDEEDDEEDEDEDEDDDEEEDEEEDEEDIEDDETMQDSQPSLDPITIKNTNANAGAGSGGMAATPVKILRRIISRTSLTTATTGSEQEPMTPSSHSTCTPPGKHPSIRQAKSLPYVRFTSGDETTGDAWASKTLLPIYRRAKSGTNVTRRRKGIPIPPHASCSHHQHRRRSRHHRHRRYDNVGGDDSANITVGAGTNGERPDEDSLFWPVSI